jgi:RNA:NAD 2'-phosphotransferase (TPT1/KptA family)
MSRTYNFRRNITLYHGTLKALLPGIMEKGLRPRGKAKKALTDEVLEAL